MGKLLATLLLLITITGCEMIPGFQREEELSDNLVSILDDFIESLQEQNSSNRSSESYISLSQREIDSIESEVKDAFSEYGLNDDTSTKDVLKLIIKTSIPQLHTQPQELLRATNIGAISKAVVISLGKNLDTTDNLSGTLGELGGYIVENINEGEIWSYGFPTAISSYIGSFIPSLDSLPITSTNINSIIYKVIHASSMNLPDFLGDEDRRRIYGKLVSELLLAIEELDWTYLDNQVRSELTLEAIRSVSDSFTNIYTYGDLSLLAHDILAESIITVHNIQVSYFEEAIADTFTIEILKEMIIILSEGIYRNINSIDSFRNYLLETLVNGRDQILTEPELDEALSQGVLNASN